MRETINMFPCEIKWISGDDIPFVDLLTRGGAVNIQDNNNGNNNNNNNNANIIVGGVSDNDIIQVSAVGLIASSSSKDYVWVDINSEEFIRANQIDNDETKDLLKDNKGRWITTKGA